MTDNVVRFPERSKALYGEAVRHFKLGEDRKAVELLMRLVSGGFANAHPLLSLIYQTGHNDVAQDFNKSLLHAERAVDDADHPEGYVMAAWHYVHGRGTSTSLQRALQYYEIAYQRYGHPVAALCIGRFHEFAWTGPMDLDKALEHYRYAESRKLAYASRRVAAVLVKQRHWIAGTYHHLLATLRGPLLFNRYGDRIEVFRSW